MRAPGPWVPFQEGFQIMASGDRLKYEVAVKKKVSCGQSLPLVILSKCSLALDADYRIKAIRVPVFISKLGLLEETGTCSASWL